MNYKKLIAYYTFTAGLIAVGSLGTLLHSNEVQNKETQQEEEQLHEVCYEDYQPYLPSCEKQKTQYPKKALDKKVKQIDKKLQNFEEAGTHTPTSKEIYERTVAKENNNSVFGIPIPALGIAACILAAAAIVRTSYKESGRLKDDAVGLLLMPTFMALVLALGWIANDGAQQTQEPQVNNEPDPVTELYR